MIARWRSIAKEVGIDSGDEMVRARTDFCLLKSRCAERTGGGRRGPPGIGAVAESASGDR